MWRMTVRMRCSATGSRSGGWRGGGSSSRSPGRRCGSRGGRGSGTGAGRVDTLPPPPVIVATGLDAARTLLGDGSLRWESGRAVLLDLGLRADRRDLFLISDLDAGGFLGRYSMADPGLAPAGHSLVQA